MPTFAFSKFPPISLEVLLIRTPVQRNYVSSTEQIKEDTQVCWAWHCPTDKDLPIFSDFLSTPSSVIIITTIQVTKLQQDNYLSHSQPILFPQIEFCTFVMNFVMTETNYKRHHQGRRHLGNRKPLQWVFTARKKRTKVKFCFEWLVKLCACAFLRWPWGVFIDACSPARISRFPPCQLNPVKKDPSTFGPVHKPTCLVCAEAAGPEKIVSGCDSKLHAKLLLPQRRDACIFHTWHITPQLHLWESVTRKWASILRVKET